MLYTVPMKRTQVYLDEEDWQRLQVRAADSGRSAAALVREAVTDYLLRSPDPDADPILAMIGEAENLTPPDGAPTDGALNHDHYLYGWPKEGEEWPERSE